MSPNDPVKDCLQDLGRRLRFDPLMSFRVLREVRDHLADAVAAERRGGAEPDEAERRAVARFGDPEAFVRELGDHATLRVIALLGSAGCMLVAGFLAFVAAAWLPAENPEDVPIVAAAAAAFLAYGGLTAAQLVRGIQFTLRHVLAAGSAIAVAVGVTSIVHSLSVAYRTGDWEAYVTAFGAALCAQGIVLLAYLALSRPGHAETPQSE